MSIIKTTISIDSELWREFSIVVIKHVGLRKKNEVIENLIRKYVKELKIYGNLAEK